MLAYVLILVVYSDNQNPVNMEIVGDKTLSWQPVSWQNFPVSDWKTTELFTHPLKVR
jgi:hypothetical protein